MNNQSVQAMKALRNIGPACAERLVEAGIDTPEKLRNLGAKEALFRIFQKRGPAYLHACYLYALHGAIEGRAWNDLPEEKKDEYKQFTKDLKNSFKKY